LPAVEVSLFSPSPSGTAAYRDAVDFCLNQFLTDLVKVDAGVLPYFQTWWQWYWAIGSDALPAEMARYTGFPAHGFEIVAVFDSDASRIGHRVGSLRIVAIDQLPRIVAEKQIVGRLAGGRGGCTEPHQNNRETAEPDRAPADSSPGESHGTSAQCTAHGGRRK